MNRFEVVSDFQSAGDRPEAIKGIVEGVNAGNRFTTLLGTTGTGQTATIAWALEEIQRPHWLSRRRYDVCWSGGARLSPVLPPEQGNPALLQPPFPS